jgi:hypothetical protein
MVVFCAAAAEPGTANATMAGARRQDGNGNEWFRSMHVEPPFAPPSNPARRPATPT